MSQRRRYDERGPNPVDEILRELNNINKLSELKASRIDELSEKFGNFLVSRKVTVNQIRKIYSEVKSLQKLFEKKTFDADRIYLLKPKLAYVAGRHRSVKPLQEVLSKCIAGKINESTDFEKFVDFFEAILAYHKYYGGR